LRKKTIKFNEEHSSNDFILKFQISIEKSFQITIELGTSRIINFKRFKGQEKSLEVENTEGKF
jgi:hypothetical protein